MIGLAIVLAKPIIWPTVIPYPWIMAKTQQPEEESDKHKRVVLAGSYNPPHNGHLSMLTYLAERYGEVVAVIGMNPEKKYKVSPLERAALLKKMVSGTDVKGKVRVEVVSGYVWRFAMKQNAEILFRGIRSWERDGKEERILQILNVIGPLILGPLKWPIPTQYLEGDPKYRGVSSTAIRDACNKAFKQGATPDLSPFVPKEVSESVAHAYCRG